MAIATMLHGREIVMRPVLAAVVLTLCALNLSLTVSGQESDAAASPGQMAARPIPADTAIVMVQAPKGTGVYSDTHKQDYGETTRFAFSGLKPGETFQTHFTVTLPSKRKVSRSLYMVGGQQFTLVFQETQEARPTLVLQRGHSQAFSSDHTGSIDARISDDGQFLVSWSLDDGDIRLWDTANGRLLRAFQIPSAKTAMLPREILHCRVESATGEIIADAMHIGIERFRWNYQTGAAMPTREIMPRCPGELIDYSPSLEYAIFRTDDREVWLYEMKNARRISKVGVWVDSDSSAGTPAPQPHFYFAGKQSQYTCKLDFEASVLTVYATATGKPIRTIRLPQRKANRDTASPVPFMEWDLDNSNADLFIAGGPFASMADGENGLVCVIVDHDQGVVTTVAKSQVEGIGDDRALLSEKLWMSALRHMKSGKLAVGRHLLSWPALKPVVSFDAPDGYSPITFSADGSRVVYVTRNSLGAAPQFLVYDTESGKRVCEMNGGGLGVSGMVLASDGKELWIANETLTWLQEFDTATGRPASPIIARRPGFLEGLMSDPAAALSLPAFSANNEVVWFEEVFDRDSGKRLFSYRNRLERPNNENRADGWFSGLFRRAYESVVSHNGQVLAFGSINLDSGESPDAGFKGMTLWNARNRNLLREVKPGSPLVFSPNDKNLLYLNPESEAIELLRVADGATISRREGPILGATSRPFACFSEDGKKIALAGAVLRLPNGEYASRPRDLDEWAEGVLDRSTNSEALSDDAIRTRVEIWDATLRNKLRTIETSKSALCAAFSPDSRLLAYSAGNEIVVLSEQGYVMRTFSTHSGNVGHLAWNADSRRLLSSSTDGTIGLWDVGTGDELARLIPLDPRLPPGTIDLDDDERGTPPANSAPPAPRAGLDRPGQRSSEPRMHFTSAFEPPPPPPAPGDDAHPARNGHGAAALADLAERDWLVVTPEGLFDGTPGGRKRISFRVGNGLNVVLVDRSFRGFYRPGLWAELWRGERPMPNAQFGDSQRP